MSARRRIAALACGVALAGLVAGCGLFPDLSGSGARPVGVEVANATDLDVTIVVNAKIIRVVKAHDRTPDPITADVLGPMPWTVEARTSTGRLLTSLVVHDGDVKYEDLGNGQRSAQGDGARVDLSCGRLDVWAGPPMMGPAPLPGVPGDCLP
jgi:hypothetical protein